MDSREFLYWLRGLAKSWTIWFAAVVATTDLWWPQVHPMLADLWGSDSAATKTLTTIMAILIVLLRVRTIESIPEKGGKNDVPQTPAQG